MFTILGADQKHYGPATVEEVRQWIRDGRADGRTLARAETGGEWKPLASFPEFAPYTSAQGTPPRLPGAPAVPATPQFANISADQILAAEPDFDIGLCLGRGWELLMANFGLLTGATFIIWLLDFAVNAIPFAGAFLNGVFFGGLYLVFLKCIRKEPTSVGEAFSGFRRNAFVQLMLAGFLSAFIASVAGLFCFFPWIYFKIAWLFCLPLVIDKRLEFWTSMELSRKVVSRIWFKVFILAVIAFLPFLVFQGYVGYKTASMISAGLNNLFAHGGTPDFTKMITVLTNVARDTAALQLTAHVILLVNLPFGTAALMNAYEALFGTRSAPAA